MVIRTATCPPHGHTAGAQPQRPSERDLLVELRYFVHSTTIDLLAVIADATHIQGLCLPLAAREPALWGRGQRQSRATPPRWLQRESTITDRCGNMATPCPLPLGYDQAPLSQGRGPDTMRPPDPHASAQGAAVIERRAQRFDLATLTSRPAPSTSGGGDPTRASQRRAWRSP